MCKEREEMKRIYKGKDSEKLWELKQVTGKRQVFFLLVMRSQGIRALQNYELKQGEETKDQNRKCLLKREEPLMLPLNAYKRRKRAKQSPKNGKSSAMWLTV